MLTVRESRSRSLSHAGGSAPAGASPRWAARSPTTCCSPPRSAHGITAVSYDDDVHPYSDLRARARRCRACSTTSWPIARCGVTPACIRTPMRWRSGTTSSSRRPETRTLRDQVDQHPESRDADGRSKRSSASGTSGTTISRRSMRACVCDPTSDRQPQATPTAAISPLERDLTISAVVVSCRRDHAACSRVWRWLWRLRSEWRSRSAASTAIR